MGYEKNGFYYEHGEQGQLDALMKAIDYWGLDNIQDMLYRFLGDFENGDYEDMKNFVEAYKHFLPTNQL